jgi:hypothetical protein
MHRSGAHAVAAALGVWIVATVAACGSSGGSDGYVDTGDGGPDGGGSPPTGDNGGGGGFDNTDGGPGFSSPDVCGNGIDDDGNGQIDEFCPCVPGTEQACYAGPVEARGKGTCAQGKQVCKSRGEFATWGPCEGSVLPKATETCDGLDDTCNGTIDEGCDCVDGTERACGSAVGVCRQGVQRCTAGKWGNCDGEVAPRTEACDGVLDEDCDGQVDNGCDCVDGVKQRCDGQGVCAGAIRECVAGRWGPCLLDDGRPQPTPRTEVCDAERLDENCDGQVNENCDCVDGRTQPCGLGLGICTRGTQTCRDGRWGTCEGEGQPRAETCNGVDDDCDGVVDNGCECAHGTTRRCGVSNVGACTFANQTCVNGAWTPCNAVLPRAEVCDAAGVDENCNGQSNEGCECVNGQARQCGIAVGECAKGLSTQNCVNGRWTECVGFRQPQPEVCDANFLDENCNGQSNEGCNCVDGTTIACGSNVGECRQGVRVCVNGNYGPCQGGRGPTAELCNADGRDEDCNGDPNNGCQCLNGQTQACGGSNVGICRAGARVCENGRWGATCVGAVGPQAEVCGNGVDEDCNGVAEPCVTTQTFTGDCRRMACPAQTPYPVGCTVNMSGGDRRGCVAWAPGDTSIFFKEGNDCGAGQFTVTLQCSSVQGTINAQTCPILNKSDRRYVSRERDCPN